MDTGRLLLIAGIALAAMTAFFCWCYAKKSAKVSKWGWRIIGLAAVLLAVFTVWYHIPISCEQTVTVYGEAAPFTPVEVELDLKVHRSCLYGKWLTGSARMCGVDYPRDYAKKHVNGSFTGWGDRGLHLTVFQAETTGFDGSLRMDLEFSGNWRTVTGLEVWSHSLSGESTFYATEESPFVTAWRSK